MANEDGSPVFAQLCALLIKDFYGDLAANVHSVLARYGRQTLAAIVQNSYLSRSQIKAGIIILVQQHLAFHSGNHTSECYYEVNWPSCYALVRTGRAAKLVQDRFGKKAANIVSNVFTLGHASIGHLKNVFFPPETDSDTESDDGAANGARSKRRRKNDIKTDSTNKLSKVDSPTHNAAPEEPARDQADDNITSPDELYALIRTLIETGWLKVVTEAQYLSPGDMHILLYQETVEQDNGGIQPTGPKDKDAVNRGTLERKRKMRDDRSKVPRFSRESDKPDDELAVCVDLEKVAVAMRTERLTNLVQQRLGPVTARVYRTMLRMLEPKIPRCYEPWPDPPLSGGEPPAEHGIDPGLLVTARDIAVKLSRDPDMDIFEGLDPNVVAQITRRGHINRNNIWTQPTDPSTLNLEEKTKIVDQHIQKLSIDPFHLVTWHSRSGFSQWRIEFDKIARELIQAEIESTISAKKNSLGVKLIRALKKKQKMRESDLCKVMMMPAADIRVVLSGLVVESFIQIQEVPKVERRETKLSTHFVFYDLQRARQKLLHDTYKGMVRILQRISYEREQVKFLLTKAERSDVIGNEEKWLSKGELDALRKWKEVQDKLCLQLIRQDELVATLRDFHGPIPSP